MIWFTLIFQIFSETCWLDANNSFIIHRNILACPYSYQFAGWFIDFIDSSTSAATFRKMRQLQALREVLPPTGQIEH